MTVSTLRVALAALLLALLAAGCGNGSSPLAKVGEKTITAEDFIEAARGNAMQYPPDPVQAKPMLLEDLVRREMMLIAAHQRGIDTSAFARNKRADIEQRTLLQALYDQVAPRDCGVSEAEARAFYAMRSQEADASVIYTIDGLSCRAAKGMLDAGMPFTEVANRFNTPGMVPPGGALGFVTPGSLLGPLDQALVTLKPGEIGGPYETPQGWFLLKVTRRQERHQQDFETESVTLTELIRQRKQRTALANAIADLKQAYHLEVTPGAPQQVFRLISSLSQGSAPPADSALANTTLATWDGGKYTMKDAVSDLMAADKPKPQTSNVPAIESWLQGQGTLRLALAEARRRHLDQEPTIAHRIRNEWESYLLEAEYTAATLHVPAPAPDAVQAVYEAVKNQFPKLKSAHVLVLTVADSAKAFAVVRHAGHGGGTLRDAVQMADPSLPLEEKNLTFPTQDPKWGALIGGLTRMSPGEFTGPEQTAEGWRVLQLLDKEQEITPYDELPPNVKQALAGRVEEMDREKAFNVYADSLRAAVKPILVQENIAKVRWPSIPGMPQSAMMGGGMMTMPQPH